MKTETWTVAQYRAHIAGRRQVPGKKKPTGTKQKAEIELMLKLLGVEYLSEHKFSDKRKFRFDWAIPSQKIAIEYEGIFGGGKSRHTTVGGYTTDTEKYNLAGAEGWTVLRYTAKNYKKLPDQLKEILSLKTT